MVLEDVFLQNWAIFGINVGKYSSTMVRIWDMGNLGWKIQSVLENTAMCRSCCLNQKKNMWKTSVLPFDHDKNLRFMDDAVQILLSV